eukprot:1152584-Pelagomonas_calceolata.AAC.2
MQQRTSSLEADGLRCSDLPLENNETWLTLILHFAHIAQNGNGAFLQIWWFWTFNSWSCPVGVVLLLTSSFPLILQSTRCEGEVGGLIGLAGHGVSKVASGRLELHLA